MTISEPTGEFYFLITMVRSCRFSKFRKPQFLMMNCSTCFRNSEVMKKILLCSSVEEAENFWSTGLENFRLRWWQSMALLPRCLSPTGYESLLKVHLGKRKHRK